MCLCMCMYVYVSVYVSVCICGFRLCLSSILQGWVGKGCLAEFRRVLDINICLL